MKARLQIRGQALVEFLVIALVLLPLFLLLPMLAKYQDIAHATQAASRYLTFEALAHNPGMSAWKPESELAREVRRRFFSNPEAGIKTGDAAGDFRAHQNPFWRTPVDEPLIERFADITISFGKDHGTRHSEGFSTAVDGVPFLVTAGRLGLAADGIYTANVHVKLAPLPEGLRSYVPFDSLDLAMTRHTSVLVDGWNARDPAQVEQRIDDVMLVPGTALRGVNGIVGAAVTVIEVGHVAPPKLGELEFWRDAVPADRLH